MSNEGLNAAKEETDLILTEENSFIEEDLHMAKDLNNKIIEFNVGGYCYTTTLETIKNEPNNLLKEMLEESSSSMLCRDSKNRIFIDRDGKLFRFILEYLRNKSIVLPENFTEKACLRREAEYYKLENMVKLLDNIDIKNDFAELKCSMSNQNIIPTAMTQAKFNRLKLNGGCITLGYRGTFSNGRDGMNDVKFRKISRILVCGRIHLCKEVFGETLNESRDPDHGVTDRYTSRFFLKHTFLEQAFDSLIDANFTLVCAAATGTSNISNEKDRLLVPDAEESKWLHYNEFIFVRI